jgi:hypothetical protein
MICIDRLHKVASFDFIYC